VSLKKKIILSFFISISIIVILAVFEYSNFIEIRKEIRHLEITDTIRSKSLQLRRHEKNFFLHYSKAAEESDAVRRYLSELNSIINEGFLTDSPMLHNLKASIKEYEQKFNVIESSSKDLSNEFEEIKTSHPKLREYFPLIESMLIEHPFQGTELLEKLFSLSSDNKLISGLKELDSQINALGKNGENILAISKELDRLAREHVDKTIWISQLAIFIFFPLFFITGIGTIFFFNRDVVYRLKALIDVVEKTGKGSFSKVALAPGTWSDNDEVSILIRKFNEMEEQLAQREEELGRKNKELFQTRKLAAIGTLASGVAHELNNPLNNIYISTQVLAREAGEACPPNIREVITDIHDQTLRVKKIVGDLLEFARGREPQFQEVDLYDLIANAFNLAGNSTDMQKIRFEVDCDSGDITIHADPEQLERVFINLFTNAAEAMSGEGDLRVKILRGDNLITIKVTDSGKGISVEGQEKIFEPFYTTKDKGTGLGLAIVFNIINKHNGKISIQSEEGKGTTFIITLPKGTK
jgi:signal transduction histidine kinase